MDAPSSGQGQSKASDAMLLVTLNVSRGNHAQQTTRRLVFTPEKPVICVGRASKVTSKGFVASEANAFFESPVMSRQHAELLANFDDKSISIKDSGSLHGTFYTSIDTASEIQLAAGQAQKLSHQDVLRFGINIFRSEITHPPTIVSVEISEEQRRSAISRLTPTNKFSVPDDVDSDDAMSDGEEGDDDSVVETPQPPRNNNVNIKTVDLTQEEPTNVIDLTTDLDRTIVIDDPEISRIDVVSVDEADVDAEHDLPVLWDSDDESSIHSDMSDKDSDVDSIEEDDESILCSEIDDMDDEDIEEEGDDFSVASHSSEDAEAIPEKQAIDLCFLEAQPSTRHKSPSDFIFHSGHETTSHEDEALAQNEQPVLSAMEESSEVNLEPADAQVSSAWENSGTSFINNPESVPAVASLKGSADKQPDVDDTSAFTFEQSKNVNAVKRLLISDLLAAEPQATVPSGPGESFASASTKRSFDTAFAADEIDTAVQNITPTVSTVANQDIVVDSAAITTIVRKTRSHAPKRRRVAELAACLALGGAGVLSALIYTAPSFA